MRMIEGCLPLRASWMPSMFQNAPRVASALPDSIAGTRLKPTSTSLTEPGETPARCSIVFR